MTRCGSCALDGAGSVGDTIGMSVLEAIADGDAAPHSTSPAVGTQVQVVPDYLKQHYVSFGGPSRFVTDSYFIAALAPLGFSRETFASLCRSLGVPIIHFNEYRLVDLFSFHLAMRAISQLGQPDFHITPSFSSKRSVLSADIIRKNYESLVRDMIVARDISITPEEARRTAEEAARRMVEFALCFRASDRQRMHDARTRAKAQAVVDRANETLSTASVDRDFPALPADPFDLLPAEQLAQITAPPEQPAGEVAVDQPPA